MKQISVPVLLFMLTFSSIVCYSQKITTGVYSGLNFSDIHGADLYSKWNPKPGPVQGFYLNYSFYRSFGITSGITYSSVYYEQIAPYAVNYYFDPEPDIVQAYINRKQPMDFGFIRIPVLLSVSIPSALQFNMKGGIFFSFMQNYTLDSYYPDLKIPEKNDFGYIFSSGLSYSLNDNIKLSLNGSYITGRKPFLYNTGYRHGSSEYTLGIDYVFSKTKPNLNRKHFPDSASKRVTVTYLAGLNYSWNSQSSAEGKYNGVLEPSFGFSLNFPLGKGYSFISGISFERNGYSMKDSSSIFYMYPKEANPLYFVDSKVLTDNAVVPFLISIPIGKRQMGFLNFGPWLGFKLNALNAGVAYNRKSTPSSYRLIKTVIYSDFEKLIKDYDVGMIFSGGVSMPVFNKNELYISLQYRSGFRNVFNKDELTTSQSLSAKDHVIRNRTISLKLGITLPQSLTRKK